MSDKSVETNYHDSFFLWFSYFLIKLILGTLVRIIWIKNVEGIKNIPRKGPVIVAFNHQSFFDFLCFISISPRHIHYISAEKFFSHKIWAPLLKLTGQIKVDRKQHDKRILHSTIYDHLKNGKMIGIFPEGTRSPYRDEMLYAFTGVAKYAVKGEVPVIPVGVKGTYDIMAKHDKRPKFRKIVTFHIGEPIHFTNYLHVKLNKKAYRILTDKVIREIAKLSGKNYSHFGRFR